MLPAEELIRLFVSDNPGNIRAAIMVQTNPSKIRYEHRSDSTAAFHDTAASRPQQESGSRVREIGRHTESIDIPAASS